MKKIRQLNKKNKIILTILFAVLFLLWMIWGNTTIDVSHVTIADEEIPKSFNDFKIAHVSDLHNKDWEDKLVKPIREEEPDIIVITGDLIDSNNPDVETAIEFIEDIQNIVPIYFVTGNHEAWTDQYSTLKENLLERTVTILDNDKLTINKDKEQILLMGLQDPSYHEASDLLNEQEAIMESNLKKLSKDYKGYKLLLSHRPEYFELYQRNEIDLVLTGHAHGGQFRLPFIGGLIAPDQGLFPESTSGVYTEKDTNMVVSRGLGDSIIPIRLNNRPELIFVQLQHSE